ncbi:bifunctional metallophosphatase/5'-nucleotidase [Segetibacter koreensis]|uniref:bifunctional metallophosphatase/5'-nucleotidase n=1 Tax=Segetibacter koreensis TaxID=398037 RepID=UPI000374132F|nr:bifunctional metallophosphatase/5'-nucleotidase [Segetibacter koreensis]
MKQYFRILFIFIVITNASCKVTKNAVATKDDGKIEIDFVQVNDVYEIAPIAGGKEGGMARVATLKRKYKQSNPNTFLIMAGDFISPSVYNSLQYNGQRIRGAQMIESMNAAGMDLVIFGNHEFDFSDKDLQDRINESNFLWVSSNTFHRLKDSIVPFTKTNVPGAVPFPQKYIMNVKDADGTTAKIGIIGLTLSSNPAEYVSYKEPLSTAKQLYDELKDSVDAVVAVTHQTVDDDIKLATELPGLAAILGGHEHSGVFHKTGNVNITKAEANAKTAYVIKLLINKKTHQFTASPELNYINEKIAFDITTNTVVQKWKKIAEDNYASLGFNPKKIVIASGEVLNGKESETRNTSTNFTRLITQAMAFVCPQADVVIFNSGSIRLDDILTPPVSEYDIIRSLPFGGGIVEADMKGSLLIQVLQAGLKNRNSGGFLQYQPVTYNNTSNLFMINNTPIDSLKTYRVAMSEFLLTGKESNLGFLHPQNPAITKMYPADTSANNPKLDIRLAIITYLESKK